MEFTSFSMMNGQRVVGKKRKLLVSDVELFIPQELAKNLV